MPDASSTNLDKFFNHLDIKQNKVLAATITDVILHTRWLELISRDLVYAMLFHPTIEETVQKISLEITQESFAKEQARSANSTDALKDLIPKTVAQELLALAENPPKLPRGFGKNIVDASFVREVLGGALKEILENFVSKVSQSVTGNEQGTPKSNGLLGTIARKGASKLRDAGSALTGIGTIIQQQLTPYVGEFASQSADRLKQSIVDHFQRPEYQDAVVAMRKRTIEAILSMEITQVYELAEQIKIETINNWAVQTIYHNQKHGPSKDFVNDQLGIIWQYFGAKSPGELLDEIGLLEPTTKIIQESISHLLHQLSRSSTFRTILKGFAE